MTSCGDRRLRSQKATRIGKFLGLRGDTLSLSLRVWLGEHRHQPIFMHACLSHADGKGRCVPIAELIVFYCTQCIRQASEMQERVSRIAGHTHPHWSFCLQDETQWLLVPTEAERLRCVDGGNDPDNRVTICKNLQPSRIFRG